MTAHSWRGFWRNLVVGGVILLFVAGGVALWLRSGGPGFGRGSKGGLDRAANGSADGPVGGRSEAFDAMREGRFAEAFGFYRNLPDRDWKADDCLVLGSALLERNRVVLGWAALEAARRFDPKHGASIRALDSLQGKLALGTGAERSVQHEAASRVELLRLIPDAPPLGLFVIGLARFATDTDQEDEFLDRLNSRDHSILRRVKTTAGALRLTARLLLETGRTTEAVELLETLVARAAEPGPGSTSSTPDPEAAWLLSRAALQLDQHEKADAMLALAGDFGKTQSALPEPAPYVGSRRCGECHRKIYREQQGESRHAQTLRFGADLKDVPLPAKPVPDPVIPSITHGFTRTGDSRIELDSRVEGRVFRAIVEYAVGSGRHGITMLAKDEEGIVRELRVSYFGHDAGWGQTKGIDFAPSDAGDHIGIGLGRKTLSHCLSCHTTWFRSIVSNPSNPKGPEGQDRGIGCERCHGPGLNHAKAAESGYAELAIALTGHTPSQERLTSCVECHAADGSIQPSDPEFTRAQGTTFLFSRCFTAGKDRFGCTTCHDPHRAVDTEASHYETKCLSCHAGIPPRGSASEAGAVEGHAAGSQRACPVNPKANCISCHMPKVEDPSRRSRFTDHHIRIHRGSAAANPPEAPR